MGHRALLLSLLVVACGRSPAARAPVVEPVTTDGALARLNLEAMIGGREMMLARNPASGSVRLTLVTLLQARSSTYGRVEDLERAEEVAERGVRLAPNDPEAWLARAASRASLHRFAEAAADLDRAQSLGASEKEVLTQRASIALARGDFAQALKIDRAHAEREPGMATLSVLGTALAESGDEAGAHAAFARALALYRDTSPFPVAFLDFQEGLLAERRGDLQNAAERYRAVLRRLPGHAQAAVHLSSIESVLGHITPAQAALRTVLPDASDPEILAARADVARRAGDTEAAAREEAAARARYLVLLGRHPDAYADHAARFFVDRDPEVALRWATNNLAVRQTPEAFDLALTAAVRARDDRARCEIAHRAGALGVRTSRLQALMTSGSATCRDGATPGVGGLARSNR